MKTLFIVVLICSETVAPKDCTTRTARHTRSYIAPQGIILCGPPGATSDILTGGSGPAPTEYMKVKCRLE